MRINPRLYKQVIATMPIACVDLIVIHRGRFLLTTRRNEPVKGQWWLPGGRIWKGERQLEAVKRKLKEETGLSLASTRFVGVFDAMFPTSSLGPPSHCINVVYLVKPRSIEHLKLDSQSSAYTWVKTIHSGLHPVMKAELRAAGF